MICVDTSTWSEFFDGQDTVATEKLKKLLAQNQIIMSEVVLCELLSSHKLPVELKFFLKEFQRIGLRSQSWELVGEMRCQLLKKGLKAKLPDCLIAQTCIDANTPLLTSDPDFRHFKKFGLQLF